MNWESRLHITFGGSLGAPALGPWTVICTKLLLCYTYEIGFSNAEKLVSLVKLVQGRLKISLAVPDWLEESQSKTKNWFMKRLNSIDKKLNLKAPFRN